MVTEKWHQAISQPVFKVEGWNLAHYYTLWSRWKPLITSLKYFFKPELWSKNYPQKHIFDHISRTIHSTDFGIDDSYSLIFFWFLETKIMKIDWELAEKIGFEVVIGAKPGNHHWQPWLTIVKWLLHVTNGHMQNIFE